MTNTFFLIVGIILAAIGVLSLAVTICQSVGCSKRVTATIVSVQKKRSNYWRGKTFYQYFPTVTYRVQDREYTTKSDFPVKSSKTQKAGEQIIIRYNPKSPESICVGVKISPYIISLIMAAIGVIFIVLYFL